MQDKGVSLISVVITIIVIILLSTIVGISSQDILKRAEENNIKQEFRNVEELVENEKAKIMAGIINIPDKYIAEDAQVDTYNRVLSNAEIQKIKQTNNNIDISSNEKYHIMNQKAFDDVFKDDINVRDVTRNYLINFDQNVIILNLDGKLYKTGEIK